LKITITSAGGPRAVEKWSNKDFLLYFSQRLEEKTGSGLTIPPPAWGMMTGRIKGFRDKLTLSGDRYKNFIDTVFDHLTTDNFVPNFGTIVSEKVFHLALKVKPKQSAAEKMDFEKLRLELYKQNTLFSKFDFKE
jgi:hypothetical protein